MYFYEKLENSNIFLYSRLEITYLFMIGKKQENKKKVE